MTKRLVSFASLVFFSGLALNDRLAGLSRQRPASRNARGVLPTARIILHKTDASFLLCYVGHHDDACHWGGRRKIEQHPKTGATQIVEVRERVEEIPVYVEVEQEAPVLAQPLLFNAVIPHTTKKTSLRTAKLSISLDISVRIKLHNRP